MAQDRIELSCRWPACCLGELFSEHGQGPPLHKLSLFLLNGTEVTPFKDFTSNFGRVLLPAIDRAPLMRTRKNFLRMNSCFIQRWTPAFLLVSKNWGQREEREKCSPPFWLPADALRPGSFLRSPWRAAADTSIFAKAEVPRAPVSEPQGLVPWVFLGTALPHTTVFVVFCFGGLTDCQKPFCSSPPPLTFVR